MHVRQHTDAPHHARQMAAIAHVEFDAECRQLSVAFVDFDVIDAGIGVVDCGCDFGDDTLLPINLNAQCRNEVAVDLRRPTRRNDLVGTAAADFGHVFAGFNVDYEALPGRHVPRDGVAGHRITTSA